MAEEARRGRGVRSVGVAVAILSALARQGRPITLGALAADLGMAPAKLHRYMAAFVEAGMVSHRRSGSYDLGAEAARIGLAALARQDPVNRAADALPELVEAVGHSAILSVWGDRGPTVVRYERSAVPLVTTLGLGSVLSVTRSATGHVFLAWLPERLADAAIRADGADPATFASVLDDVREAGIAAADQSYIPGLHALAAPVLDVSGALVAVATLVSASEGSLRADGAARAALLAFVRG